MDGDLNFAFPCFTPHKSTFQRAAKNRHDPDALRVTKRSKNAGLATVKTRHLDKLQERTWQKAAHCPSYIMHAL